MQKPGRVMLRENEVQEEEEMLGGRTGGEAQLPSLISKHFPLPPSYPYLVFVEVSK